MTGLTRTLRHADEACTAVFDHAFAPGINPWRHLGAMAFLCLVLAVASGIVCYTLYDTSVTGAYQSGLRLQNDTLLLGRLLRGLHRYGADACLLLTLLHLLREGLRGHYSGVRWFSWLTGVPLLWLLWMAGLTGLWLLWDARALLSITVTAEWLQALPIGAELLARNFLTPEALNDRFFSLIMCIHIGVPLLLLASIWVHVQRVSRVRMWPPRALLLSTLTVLSLLSMVLPASSLGVADFSHVPQTVSLDWFYLFIHPLVEAFSAATVWWGVTVFTLAVAALPLLRSHRDVVRSAAQVDLANCNGCSRCVADCPFGAVTMVARTDGTRYRVQASVNPDLCAACGICVGACPSSTPFRRIEDMVSGIEMPATPIAPLRRELQKKVSSLSGSHKIVVFSCRQAGNCTSLANASTAVVELECAAMLPPSFIEYALRMGASGAVVAGCREADCEFRLGDQWVKERILGAREPYLRASVPRERIALSWSGRDMLDVSATISMLRAQVSTLDGVHPSPH